MCIQESLLDLENEKYMVSLSGQCPTSPFSCYCLHLGVCVHRGQTPAAQLEALFLVPQNHTVNELVSEKPKLKLRQVWFLGTHTHKKFSSCTFRSSVVALFFFFFKVAPVDLSNYQNTVYLFIVARFENIYNSERRNFNSPVTHNPPNLPKDLSLLTFFQF